MACVTLRIERELAERFLDAEHPLHYFADREVRELLEAALNREGEDDPED